MDATQIPIYTAQCAGLPRVGPGFMPLVKHFFHTPLPPVGRWWFSLQPLQWEENKQGAALLTQEGWRLSFSSATECPCQFPLLLLSVHTETRLPLNSPRDAPERGSRKRQASRVGLGWRTVYLRGVSLPGTKVMGAGYGLARAPGKLLATQRLTLSSSAGLQASPPLSSSTALLCKQVVQQPSPSLVLGSTSVPRDRETGRREEMAKQRGAEAIGLVAKCIHKC